MEVFIKCCVFDGTDYHTIIFVIIDIIIKFAIKIIIFSNTQGGGQGGQGGPGGQVQGEEIHKILLSTLSAS